MSNLLSELREHSKELTAPHKYSGYWPMGEAMLAAADEIERLTAECAQLRRGYTAAEHDHALEVGMLKMEIENLEMELRLVSDE